MNQSGNSKNNRLSVRNRRASILCLLQCTSDNVVCIIFSSYPHAAGRDLKFEVLSSNVVLEEFVLSEMSPVRAVFTN